MQRDGSDHVFAKMNSRLTHTRTVWQFLVKVTIKLLYQPAIILLDIRPKETKGSVPMKTVYKSSDSFTGDSQC